MKRPIVAIIAVGSAIGAALLSMPFLIAVIRNPFGQDTPIWLALGLPAALSSALALRTSIARTSLTQRNLATRAFLYILFVLPAAFLLGALTSNPP